MMKHYTPTAVVLCLTLSARLFGLEATGPPRPVPYKRIPDPPGDADRRIVVKAEDRGPVWLLTGFLSQWYPEMDFNMIARLKPRHWRHGHWPFWFPRSITVRPKPQWGDLRDSPEALGRYLETVLRLRETGMSWQVELHHKGRYYGGSRSSRERPSRATTTTSTRS